ncbi:MAG: regulatory iron-sulfur-containing complex subunit RicT [Acidobacteriota bacterium]
MDRHPIVGVIILDTHEFGSCRAEAVSLVPDELCVVQASYGLAMGQVVARSACQLSHCEHKNHIWRLIRRATEDDRRTYQRNRESEARAWEFCQGRVRERVIPLKLVRIHYLFDGTKAVFYYTAEGRIDFRELVKDLARELRMKIEMRQIGVRDEARMIDGYGTCGRELCCGAFLRNFEPVTLSMAKHQNLGCNPCNLTGLCGRLKCCLRYEYEGNGAPARGNNSAPRAS